MFQRRIFIEESLNESAATKMLMLEKCYTDINKAADELVKVVKNEKKIMFIGNGGSAADSPAGTAHRQPRPPAPWRHRRWG